MAVDGSLKSQIVAGVGKSVFFRNCRQLTRTRRLHDPALVLISEDKDALGMDAPQVTVQFRCIRNRVIYESVYKSGVMLELTCFSLVVLSVLSVLRFSVSRFLSFSGPKIIAWPRSPLIYLRNFELFTYLPGTSTSINKLNEPKTRNSHVFIYRFISL